MPRFFVYKPFLLFKFFKITRNHPLLLDKESSSKSKSNQLFLINKIFIKKEKINPIEHKYKSSVSTLNELNEPIKYPIYFIPNKIVKKTKKPKIPCIIDLITIAGKLFLDLFSFG